MARKRASRPQASRRTRLCSGSSVVRVRGDESEKRRSVSLTLDAVEGEVEKRGRVALAMCGSRVSPLGRRLTRSGFSRAIF